MAAVPDDTGATRLRCFAVLTPEVEWSAALEREILDLVRSPACPRSRFPWLVLAVDALPRTFTGKLRRHVLRSTWPVPSHRRRHVAPGTACVCSGRRRSGHGGCSSSIPRAGIVELIVRGAGPVGLSAALALRAEGLAVTVLEAASCERAGPGCRAIFVLRESLLHLERARPGMGLGHRRPRPGVVDEADLLG